MSHVSTTDGGTGMALVYTRDPLKLKRVVWFARGGGVARMGPFDTQVEAARMLKINPGPGSNDEFPSDAFIWPEEAP